MSEETNVIQLAERLRGMYDAAEVQLPDEVVFKAPLLNLHLPIDDLAKNVADLLKSKNLLFRRGVELGTLDPQTGEWEVMTTQAFRTFLPNAGIFPYKKMDAGKHVKDEISAEMAMGILASKVMRTKMPEVVRVNRVKLPVLRKELDERGNRKMELLKTGYDAESKTFTILSGVDYNEEMDAWKAREHVWSLLRYFPWTDVDMKKEQGRSLAVHMAQMFTVFCDGLYLGKAPMFLYNANMKSSGKSVMASIILNAVYGDAAGKGWSFQDQKENKQTLDAEAQAFSSYIFFDDLPKGRIASSDLNRWLTIKTWSCRVLGKPLIFKGPTPRVTVMTGNQLELSDELDRRTLVVDLFMKIQARDKELPADAVKFTERFFADRDEVGKLLAAMWAMVKNWDEGGRVVTKEKPLGSFDDWSEVICSMVEYNDFGNALQPFEAPDAGDTRSRDFKLLAKAIIAKYCTATENGKVINLPRAEVTMRDVIRCARLNGLFPEVLWTIDQVMQVVKKDRSWTWESYVDPDNPVGTAEEPTEEQKREQVAAWTDHKMDSKWGNMVKNHALAGQYFQSQQGHWYEFGKRGSSRASKFELVRLEK